MSSPSVASLEILHISRAQDEREQWGCDTGKLRPVDYLHAARVPLLVAEAEFGVWTIKRRQYTGAMAFIAGCTSQTILYRLTPATMHLPPGEIVMEDSRPELQRHLPIWMAARGRVLITGLGLGCVVRGLLIKPDVTDIDVIEIDRGIISHIAPEFEGNPRVHIHRADALTWPVPAGQRWNFAWHDIHDDDGKLQVLHGNLMARFKEHVTVAQGAWAFPRWACQLIQRSGQPYLDGRTPTGRVEGMA